MSIQEISPYRKELILKVADGDYRVMPFVHQLEYTYKREEIYRWLIRHRITGAEFYNFWMFHGSSFIRVVKHILRQIHDDKLNEVCVGRDIF